MTETKHGSGKLKLGLLCGFQLGLGPIFRCFGNVLEVAGVKLCASVEFRGESVSRLGSFLTD